MSERRSICGIHNDINTKVGMAVDFLKSLPEDVYKNHGMKELREMLKGISEDTREAKQAGIRMNRRLLDYKNAIEDLGFVRVKK